MTFRPLPFALVVAWCWCGIAWAQDKGAEQTLREAGLTKLGSVYVLEGEKKAPQAVAALSAAQRALDVEERQRAQLRGQVRNGKAAMDRWEAELRSTTTQFQRTPRSNVDVYNGLIADMKLLESKIREGERALADLEAKLEKAPDSTDKYITLVLDTSSAFESTAAQYEALARDEKVVAAINTMNETVKPKVKLGPSPQFEQNVRFVQRLRGNVNTEVVKLQFVNGVPVAPVTINGGTTEPMIIDSGAAIVLLTWPVAQRAGLKPGPTDAKMNLRDAAGRVTQASVMTLRTVKLGQFTAEDVTCAVMPADSKAETCLLGGTFLKNFVYRTDLNKGELHLTHLKKAGTPGGSSAASATSPPAVASPAPATASPGPSPAVSSSPKPSAPQGGKVVTVLGTHGPQSALATGVRLKKGQSFVLWPNEQDRWGGGGTRSGTTCDYRGYDGDWMAMRWRIGTHEAKVEAGKALVAPYDGELALHAGDARPRDNTGSIRVIVVVGQ